MLCSYLYPYFVHQLTSSFGFMDLFTCILRYLWVKDSSDSLLSASPAELSAASMAGWSLSHLLVTIIRVYQTWKFSCFQRSWKKAFCVYFEVNTGFFCLHSIFTGSCKTLQMTRRANYKRVFETVTPLVFGIFETVTPHVLLIFAGVPYCVYIRVSTAVTLSVPDGLGSARLRQLYVSVLSERNAEGGVSVSDVILRITLCRVTSVEKPGGANEVIPL